MYQYRATVDKIVDGDTVDVTVDLGFQVYTKQRLRLYGINTPETRGDERAEGLISKEFVQSKLPLGSNITIITEKDKTGKYGRYLATIVYGDNVNLNVQLVKLGLAEEYMV